MAVLAGGIVYSIYLEFRARPPDSSIVSLHLEDLHVKVFFDGCLPGPCGQELDLLAMVLK
jgi:hypothetical protein